MSKKNNSKPKDKIIAIGIPNTGYIDYRTVARLINFKVPYGYRFNFSFMANSLVYTAREAMAEYAIKAEATHLLFVDSDMIPPHETIDQLLKADKDIISAMIFKRSYPYQPCFYSKCRMNGDKKTGELIPILEGPMEPETWPKEGVFEMEGVGTACTLISIKVFKKLEKPWFFPLPNMGEDLAFCIKARQAGFKIWTDFGLDCGHVSSFEVNKAVFVEGYKQWTSDPKNQGKLMFGEV
jgi:GT2 family glycosyltransferase